jgi:transcription termination factor Rho
LYDADQHDPRLVISPPSGGPAAHSASPIPPCANKHFLQKPSRLFLAFIARPVGAPELRDKITMANQLERSALESKERDELVTIAVALGGKPAARAKKSTIIDLILELTGVTSSAPEAGTESPDAEPTPARRPRRPRNAAAESAPDVEAAVPADAGDVELDGQTEPTVDAPESDDTSVPTRTAREQREPRAEGEADSEGDGDGRRRRRRGRDRDNDRGGDRPGRSEESFFGEPIPVSGVLDLRDEGYGFVRVNSYLSSREDVYVSVKQARQFSLRRGDLVAGTSRPAARNEKNPALLTIDSVNGLDPDLARDRRRFEDLTPLFPDEKLHLSSRDEPYNMTSRIIDLIAPIGKGQRGLIVSPPKAGKTTIMKQIAKSIEENNPEVHLIVLLVDERPEEVTDMRRSVGGEVVASTFDRPAEEHTAVAELVIERAKRMVEEGKDVVVILDGITRLARAYNLAAPATGRVMSGGIDTGALYPPKKFFGAARNVEEGGSLTILASALVETGSRMDEVIFEEFKGTGNMELRLDRRMAERRIYPAIDVDASSTRHEELLFDRTQLQEVYKLRRVLSGLASEGGSGAPGLEMLIDRLGTFRTNDEFLAEIAKG